MIIKDEQGLSRMNKDYQGWTMIIKDEQGWARMNKDRQLWSRLIDDDYQGWQQYQLKPLNCYIVSDHHINFAIGYDIPLVKEKTSIHREYRYIKYK